MMPTPPHLPDTFAVGAKVVLVGLERLAHLNGTVGVVAGYFSSSLRHSVKLDGLKVSVRPCNMRALQSQAVGASAGIADACRGGFSLAPDGGVKQPPVAVSPLLGVPAPADDIEFLTTCSSATALPALPEDKAAAALSVVPCSGSHISALANVGADVVTWSVSSLRAALKDRGLSVHDKQPALLRHLGTALASSSSSTTRIRMGDTRAQVNTLSQGDGVPDLVDLVATPPKGRTSLVTDSSSTFQAVSASPQPTYGCACLSPPHIAGSDANAVLREPDPP